MNDSPRPNPDNTIDQTPPLDPEDAIHAKVLAMDETLLHTRRVELRSKGQDITFDELTELCAVLARLRAKKSGPPAGATTRKRLKDPSKQIDINSLEF
jgi:hypothetical protein